MTVIVYIIILLVVILASMLIVRIGSVALRFTGLDPETSSFQAVSAFTGTGFTTSEADLITKHPGRRKTVKYLIIFGNAYFATVVAMFISTVTSLKSDEMKNYTYVISLAIIIAGLILWRLSLSQRFQRWLDHVIEGRLARSGGYKMFQLQHVLDLAGGYTVSEFRVKRDSWLVGRSLMELALAKYKLLILAIERGLRLVQTPTAATKIQENDNLVCYGPIDGMKVLIEGPPAPPGDAKTAVHEMKTRVSKRSEGADDADAAAAKP
ncbi:MAG: TrkA C-terminal domain-containing protein [Planctomycetota bacterium]